MASAVIHICVAKRVNEKLKMCENDLILGSIAPDIAKQIGEKKNRSHFLNDNDKEDKEPNINRFLKLYKSELSNPFDMGYFIHLLTDKYWFRDYVYNYLNIYSLKEFGKIMSYTELKKIIYNDFSNINIELIDKYNISLDLFSNEQVYPDSIIKEIPMDKINIIVEKMGIIIANSTEQPTIIFKIDSIVKFIEECSLKILDIIDKYQLYSFEGE